MPSGNPTKAGRTGIEWGTLAPRLFGETLYESVSRSFGTQSITKYTLTTLNTRREAAQSIMAAKLTRLTHKIAIQLHLVAERCIICSSRSRRPVLKLLDTPSYTIKNREALLEASREVCLQVNTEKTTHGVVCRQRNVGHYHKLLIVNKSYENVAKFKYLRTIHGKKDEVSGGWRRLHSEELHNLYAWER
jgi:hypothetical protein